MSRNCCVALPCGAMGLSAVCDCGISWSYSLIFVLPGVIIEIWSWQYKKRDRQADRQTGRQTYRQTLEQRQAEAEARLIMFYKIVHGLVQNPLPTFIQRHIRMTWPRHSFHCKYSYFPFTIVQWNNLPHSAILSEDLTSFRSAICSLSHNGIFIFYQLLTFYFFLILTLSCFLPLLNSF